MMSFEVGPKTVYRGSLATKIVSITQKSVLAHENGQKMTSFDIAPVTVYRGSLAPKIVPGTQNSVL